MSQTNEDFLTSPLKGLLPKPIDEMTESELRDFAEQVRKMRNSHQTYKSEIERHEASKQSAQPKSKPNLEEFNELF